MGVLCGIIVHTYLERYCLLPEDTGYPLKDPNDFTDPPNSVHCRRPKSISLWDLVPPPVLQSVRVSLLPPVEQLPTLLLRLERLRPSVLVPGPAER